MAPEVIACDENPDATYDNKVCSSISIDHWPINDIIESNIMQSSRFSCLFDLFVSVKSMNDNVLFKSPTFTV